MFMFEAVVLTGVPERQTAVAPAKAGDAAAVYRRPGYPGSRHFNENYIGSWLLEASKAVERKTR
jgi:hypothetical protein